MNQEIKINEYSLQITGAACIPKELDRQKRLQITNAELEIYNTSDKDNQDGTYNRKYSARITSHVDLVQDGDKIRSKDKRSKSKQFRDAIWSLQQEEGIQANTDVFYDKFMAQAIYYVRDIYELIKEKNK